MIDFWKLYNLAVDPGETLNLAKKDASMIKDYSEYAKKNGVLEMEINDEPLDEISNLGCSRIEKSNKAVGIEFYNPFDYFLRTKKV